MEMIPEVPELPAFPEVTWFLVDCNYAVSAADADQILDYLENQIPAYSFRMEQFKMKLIILKNTLSEDV